MKRWGDVSRETEQGRGDVSRETKEGGVPVSGGGLPFLPPAALAFSLLFCPHPPCPPSRREGGDQGYFMQGAPPLASPGLNPGGTGYFLPRQCFLPHPPRPPSRWEGGDFCFILPGAGAPGTPATEAARHWLYLRDATTYILPEVPLSMHIYESSGGFGGLFQESPDVSFPQKVGIRGRESFEMLLQRKGKCGIL